MFRTMLKSKIHRATVTQADLDYVGSITIDSDLMKAADVFAYEKVHVVDIDNGARLETYAIEGDAGSGLICINGAAARLVSRGDRVIIMSYAQVSEEEARTIRPTVVLVDESNRPVSIGTGVAAGETFGDLISG
jgi:aspartate 1-decarboxylase